MKNKVNSGPDPVRRSGGAPAAEQAGVGCGFGPTGDGEMAGRIGAQTGHLAPWEINLITGEVIHSPQLLEMFGLPPTNPVEFREQWRARIHPEDRADVQRAVGEAAAGKDRFHVHYRFVDPHGQVHWHESQGNVLPGPRGPRERLVGIVADVTDRRRAEAALAAELEDTRLLQSISAALIEESRVEVVYEKIMDAAVAIMRSDFASMQQFCAERGEAGELLLLAHRGFAPRNAEAWKRVGIDTGSSCGESLRTGLRAVAADVENSPFIVGTAGLAAYRDTGIRAVQSTPLFSRTGKLVGVVSTHWRAPHQPSERDFRLFDILARMAADLLAGRQAQDSIRASEARYRAIVENTTAVILRVNPRGVITFANSRALEFFGYSADELIGKHAVGTIVAPRDTMGRDLAAMVDGIAANPDDFHANANENLCKDGRRVWVEWTNSGIFDEQGRLTEFLSVGIDATDRRLAEQDVERFKALMDHNPSLAFLKDESGKYVYLNRSYEAHFVGSKDWLGKTDFDFWPEESAELLRANDEEVLKSGKTRQYLEDSTSRDGTRYCWLCYKFVFIDSQDRKYLGGIGIDVTERVRAEEALRQSEARYRLLHESMRDAFVQVSMDGQITDCNDAYCQIVGHTSDEVRKLTYQQLTPERWHAIEERIVQEQIIARGYSDVYEKEYQRKDGTIFPVELRTILSRDDAGKPIGMWGVVRDITERKQAELRLRQVLAKAEEGDRLLEALMAHVPEGITICDAAGRVSRISRRGQEMLGGAHAGKSVAEIAMQWAVYCPDGQTIMDVEQLPLARALRGEVVLDAELVQVSSHGERLPLLCNAAPVRDADGRIVGGVVAWRDITERKRGEEVLRQRAEEVERLLEVVPAAVWVSYDPECRTITGNPLANEFYEADAGENVSATSRPEPRRFFAMDGREMAPDDLPMQWAARTNQEVHGAGIRVQLPSGRQIAMLGSAVPLRDEAGQVRGCIGAFLDVTAHMRAEEALKQLNAELEQRVTERTAELTHATQAVAAERQRLFDVLETLPTAICLLRDDFSFAFANRAFREQFGTPDGKPCHELCFGRSEPCQFCQSFEPLRTGLPHQWEVRLDDGRVLDVHDFPFTDVDGTRMILEMDFDITERLRAEAAVRAAHAELACRAAQLRALASQLTLAEQRERRRLAEVLHDDLQQLLVGAKFRLFTLNHSPDQAAKAVAAEVEELIDQSIECSRTLTGELSPPILYQGGLVPALEWLAVWVQQKHGLDVHLQTQDIAVPESDDLRVLMFQSVRELLLNTVKHAGVRKAEVCLRKTDDHIEMTVADAGVGFDPAAAVPHEGKGGGFGLFSIRERLNLLGGAMEIDSAPGRGSRFTIRAPIAAPAAVMTRVAEQAGTRAGTRISRMGPEPPELPTGASRIRVLLIDDHVVVRQGLSHLLREEPDIEVVGEASDGRTGIEMVRQLRPEVVTMDISMPGMDGVETTKIIHAGFPDVKVIGLSMFEEGQRGQAMIDAGAASYLAKSGPSEALIAAIRALAMPLSGNTAGSTVGGATEGP